MKGGRAFPQRGQRVWWGCLGRRGVPPSEPRRVRGTVTPGRVGQGNRA